MTLHTSLVLGASDLGKRYGSRWIFRGISFQLQKGDRLAILGSNGTGKSTLLRCVAGLLSVNEGTIQMPEGDHRSDRASTRHPRTRARAHWRHSCLAGEKKLSPSSERRWPPNSEPAAGSQPFASSASPPLWLWHFRHSTKS